MLCYSCGKSAALSTINRLLCGFMHFVLSPLTFLNAIIYYLLLITLLVICIINKLNQLKFFYLKRWKTLFC